MGRRVGRQCVVQPAMNVGTGGRLQTQDTEMSKQNWESALESRIYG